MDWFRHTLGTVDDPRLLGRLAASAAMVVVVVLLRWLLGRVVRLADIRSADLRRRWIVQVRNMCFLILVGGLVAIWASELRTMAISLAAMVVAVVLATKELFQCLTGGFLKVSSRSFGLGDRIEVGAVRGDVIDQTLLTTTILEIGPGNVTHQHTGRAVTLPNSVYLTTSVINESFTHDYVLHVFTVPMSMGDDWESARDKLLAAAGDVCGGYLDEARRHIYKRTTREGIESLSVDPRVTLSLPAPGRVDLIVRVPTPARRKGRVEQAILQRYMTGKPVSVDL